MCGSNLRFVLLSLLVALLLLSCSEYKEVQYMTEEERAILESGGLSFSSSVEESSSSSEEVSSSSDEESSSSSEDSSSSGALPLCGSDSYDPSTQFCLGGLTVTNLCGGYPFETNQFCNNNNVYDNCGTYTNFDGSSYGCCAGALYFFATHGCCNYETYSSSTDGCCGTSKYTLSTDFCSSNNTIVTKCGGSTYEPSTHFCSDNNIVAKCGGDNYEPSTQFCYNNSKVVDKCGQNPQTYNPDLYECKPSSNGIYLKGGVKDNSGNVVLDDDDNGYEAVLIGAQVWMAENFNYRTENGSVGIEYGRLYDWEAAQTVCPSGWHLPSDAEWTELTNYVGSSTAGTKLKSASEWNTSSGYIAGTDDYGFAALPGGIGDSDGNFAFAGDGGFWWSSSGSSDDTAYNWIMVHNDESVLMGNYSKHFVLSVRCLQD
jgi:uncharacterized protein (TIGR02145 family)